MNRPLISIIVPVYKVENYLHRCVDSILAQSFSDFEVILVDDGSPDNCGNICDGYARKDKRVKVIHKHNAGVSSARNVGINAAIGKYIAFCDSDDYYLIDAFNSLYRCAYEEQADYVVAQSFNQSVMNDDGKDEGKTVISIKSLSERFKFIIDKLNGKHGTWAVWNSLYKKEIIINNNIEFCENCGDYAEDIAFNINYLLYCDKIVEIKRKLYCYNDMREDSMMSKSSNSYKLNEANEAAFSIENNYLCVFKKSFFESYFHLIHFQFLEEEYLKFLKNDKIKMLPDASKSINKYQWYINNTKRFLKDRKIVFEYYDYDSAIRALTLPEFIVNGSIIKYRVKFFLNVHLLNRKH